MIDPLQPAPRERISFDQGDVVFLCEGMDDCALVAHLTKRWARPPKVGTRPPDSRWSWDREFADLAKQVIARKISAVGFVFDAEQSRGERLNRLRSWYAAANFTMPSQESQLAVSGLAEGVSVRTGYILIPPDAETGSLEDLFLPQVAASPIASCIDDLLRCYSDREPSRESESKLRLRTFLAHKNAYNTGLNVALRDGHVTCEGPEFAPLLAFVHLFGS
ncbi:MAG: DUF3226 domain-containing protein [Planctomycetota bacterium]